MKTLIFIIGFVAILASSTYFVAPLFRGYHEGKLKQRTEKTLHDAGFSNLYTGYVDVDVEMNHLHASDIVVTVNKHNKHSNEEIEAQVEELVRKIPGVHTEKVYISVNREDERSVGDEGVASQNKQVDEGGNVEIAVAKPNQSYGKPKNSKDLAKGMGAKSPEKVIPQPEPKIVRVSSELYVEWNDSKNEINVDGKLSSKEEKRVVVEPLLKSFGADHVKDSLIVSKKLVNAPAHLKEVASLIPQVATSCRGAGSVKYVDQPAKIEIRGGLKSKADFAKVEELLASHRKKKLTVVNALKYFPEFSIEKNDEKREVILSGYADKYNSVNFSSYVKRYTPLKKNEYTFKSDISSDSRCEEYTWKASDQALLDRFLANVVRGKLVFRNDKIAEISGITANEDYHRRLKEEMLGTGVKYSLIYDQYAKPVSPKAVDRSTTDESLKGHSDQKVMAQAKEDLKNQLKEFKIYFASGEKGVDAKYDKDIQKIAQTILSSKDRKSQIVIGGYADHSGSAAANETLSKARATSVQTKLVALGVPITRTKVEFFGAEKASKEKWRSRRVEIRVR